MLYDCTMNTQASHVSLELGARADQEGEGVVIRGEVVVVGVENVGVKMEAFGGCGAFGIGPDHGVESEEGWVVLNGCFACL